MLAVGLLRRFAGLSVAPTRAASSLIVVKSEGRQLKRPPTPFFQYLSQLRTELWKDPSAKRDPIAVAQLASKQWKAMPAEEKQKFVEANKVLVAEFSKKVDTGKAIPSKPKSPSCLFVSSQLNSGNKAVSMKQQLGTAAKTWRTMSDAEKQPFVQKAEEDKKRFEREMAEFKGSMSANELAMFEKFQAFKQQHRAKTARSVYKLTLVAGKSAVLSAWGIEPRGRKAKVYPTFDELTIAQRDAVEEATKKINDGMRKRVAHFRAECGIATTRS
eukprot:m.22411 g.22411  ORF g.22411 m.22411 type:complete len:272 (+) comp3745_c0_seq2:415-1230(+)